MKRCKVYLESIPGSPYSQSAQHDTPKLDRESHDDYDVRTWREKCTTNKDGNVCIPAMALKQALDTTAFKLGVKVEGRRGATFKGFFASGFFCEQDVVIANGTGKPLTKKDAMQKTIQANADGVRGSGKRVTRRFPQFETWKGVASFVITDDILSEQIFEQHVKSCGIIVGVGRFRPEKGGINGRFRVTKVEWETFAV
jgi:hypothetical protein